MKLEFKQLINIDENTLTIISTWMYNWWEKMMDIVLKK